MGRGKIRLRIEASHAICRHFTAIISCVCAPNSSIHFLFVGFVFYYLKFVCWWGRSGQDVDPSLSKMSASGSIANGELACREDSKGGSVYEHLPTSL